MQLLVCYAKETLKNEFTNYAKDFTDGEYNLVDLYFYRDQGNYTHEYRTQIVALFEYKSNAYGSTDVQYFPLILSTDNVVLDDKGYLTVDNYSRFQEGDLFDSVSDFEEKYSKSENGVTVLSFEKIN